MSTIELVFVLSSHSDSETELLGVFREHSAAEDYKNTYIRECFAIDEDECADADLENEVADSVTFTIIGTLLR